MDVELLVIPRCPGPDEVKESLRTAFDDIGLADTVFTVRINDTDDVARARRFAGSPAFLVDSLDMLDSGPGGGSMACRVYPTPDGPRNLPPLRPLRKALKGTSGSSSQELNMDVPLAVAQGHPDPPPGRCWCCGAIDDPDRMVHLGNHPEVAICRPCARWVAKKAWEIEDRDKTGALVTMRERFRHLRRGVIDRKWHRLPVIGRPLRWLGRHLP